MIQMGLSTAGEADPRIACQRGPVSTVALAAAASRSAPAVRRDRLPFLTDVRTGSPSLVLAFNTLESNFFLPTDEPYPIDSDDGCNQLNVSSNVLIGNAAIKTDFGGHTKVSLI